MKKLNSYFFIWCLLVSVNLNAQNWTWLTGSNTTVNTPGIYGIQGVSNSLNTPGAKYGGAGWVDKSGNLWLFGGYHSPNNDLNDMWKFDMQTGEWVWVKGSNSTNQEGVYGLKGVTSPINIPGARSCSATWVDKQGNFWLFGGSKYNGAFNDLWKFDYSLGEWIWMKGSTTTWTPAVYGTKGVQDPANTPSARYSATTWTDKDGNFWLFGGAQAGGYINDLWKYDVQSGNWVWIGGKTFTYDSGSYGIKGIPSSTNLPSARTLSATWVDLDGNFWLYGGHGSGGAFCDLWKYEIISGYWTWIGGSTGTNQPGNYGVKGIPDLANYPGTKAATVSWVSMEGDFYLFGGNDYDGRYSTNSFWKYSPSTGIWVWIGGSNIGKQSGIYGTRGIGDPTNIPGARSIPTGWITNNGRTFYMFGGGGFIGAGVDGLLNELWQFNIIPLNNNPIANAGEDQTFDCAGVSGVLVSLHGENSYDPDNDPLTYVWKKNGNTIATGVTPTINLLSGVHTITLTVDDGKGGSSSDNVIITINTDLIAPVPDIANLPIVKGDCSATIVTSPTATDACSGFVTGTTNDPLVYTSQGTYTVTWTYIDGNGNSVQQIQTVVVKDITAPVPDVANLPIVTGECSAKVETPPTATDACSGFVTGTTNDPLVYSSQGIFTVTWTYSDSHGNSVQQIQKVVVKDKTAPVPDFANLPTVKSECSATVVTSPTATDACSGSIIGTTNNPLVYSSQGTFTITWIFSDGNGNSVEQKQTVVVKDATAPAITSTKQIISLWPPDHKYETIKLSDFGVSVSDNCTNVTTASLVITKVTSDEVEDSKGNGDGNTKDDIVLANDFKSVNLRKEREGTGNGRVYTIYISVSDGNGNVGSSSFQVQVPHDKKDTAVDDGSVYEVLGGSVIPLSASVNGSAANELSSTLLSTPDSQILPEGFELKQNYPNPFNPTTQISFDIPKQTFVELKIFDALGKEIAVLTSREHSAGRYNYNFGATGLPSGIYFYHLDAGEFQQTKKMLLLK